MGDEASVVVEDAPEGSKSADEFESDSVVNASKAPLSSGKTARRGMRKSSHPSAIFDAFDIIALIVIGGAFFIHPYLGVVLLGGYVFSWLRSS